MSGWFQRPIAPPGATPEDTRDDPLLHVVLAALGAVLLFAAPIFGPGATHAAWPVALGVLAAVAAGAVALDRHGRRRAASGLVVGGLWGAATLAAVATGGADGPGAAAWVAVVVTATLLLDARAGALVAALSVAAGWLLVALEEGGALALGLHGHVDGGAWAVVHGALLATAAFLAVAERGARSLRRRAARLEHARRVAEERFHLVAEGSNDALWDWNLRENTLDLGCRWRELLGLPDAPDVARPEAWLGRLHPSDRDRVEAALQAALEGDATSLQAEFRLRHEGGAYLRVFCRAAVLRDEAGTPVRLAGSMTDVTRSIQGTGSQVLYDELTGLANRALFLDRVRRAMSRSGRAGAPSYAVLFIDLDRFKVVNDSLGYLAGNDMLRAISRRVQNCLRPGDSAARLTSDEFAVLLEDLDDLRAVVGVAERIQERLGAPFQLDGREVFITASIGIALGDPAYEDAEEVLRDADIAMYRAKLSGKGRCEEFVPAMQSQALEKLEMESDLRRAIDRGELAVAFQPVVDLATRQLAGFEALVRWHHATRGEIAPSDFVPLAEETGLVVELDRWVLRHACRQMTAWRARHPAARGLRLSVNLASQQFTRPDLVDTVMQVLHQEGFPPEDLTLEITERALLHQSPATAGNLHALRAFGIRIAVDDFGTGYSSLSYLHRFPVSTIKIDRSFVSDLDSDAAREPIVRAIISMARHLDMGVIAEGVETLEQLRILQGMGCGRGQGYLFSSPQDAIGAERFLQPGFVWVGLLEGLGLAPKAVA